MSKNTNQSRDIADLQVQIQKLRAALAEVIHKQLKGDIDVAVLPQFATPRKWRVLVGIERIESDGTVIQVTTPYVSIGEFASHVDAGDCFDLLVSIGRKHHKKL